MATPYDINDILNLYQKARSDYEQSMSGSPELMDNYKTFMLPNGYAVQQLGNSGAIDVQNPNMQLGDTYYRWTPDGKGGYTPSEMKHAQSNGWVDKLGKQLEWVVPAFIAAGTAAGAGAFGGTAASSGAGSTVGAGAAGVGGDLVVDTAGMGITGGGVGSAGSVVGSGAGAAGYGAGAAGAAAAAAGGGILNTLSGYVSNPLVQVGTSLVSGAIANNAAKKAADAQRDAANTAIAEQRRQYDQTRTDLAPWRDRGTAASNRLAVMMGLAGDATDPNFNKGYRTAQTYTPNPIYAQRQDALNSGFMPKAPNQLASFVNALNLRK